MAKTTLIQRMLIKGVPKSWIAEVQQMLKKIETLEGTTKEHLNVIDSLARQVEEKDMLKNFWDRVCEIMWDCGDLDGGTFQDWGVDIGLLREEIYDPEGKHKDVFIMDAMAGDPVFINVLSEKVNK